jgi:hypothetical protein
MMPDPSPSEEASPKLASVQDRDSDRVKSPRAKAAFGRKLGRPIGWAVLGLLFVFAIGALGVQTRRVETLAVEVEGLQLELGDARRQLDVYQAQIDLVRDSLSGVLDELTMLHALVSDDSPVPPASPAEEDPPNAE